MSSRTIEPRSLPETLWAESVMVDVVPLYAVGSGSGMGVVGLGGLGMIDTSGVVDILSSFLGWILIFGVVIGGG